MDQHQDLVAELEHRIKTERGRYRELQERTHQQVQTLEGQVATLQESCDLHDYSFSGSAASSGLVTPKPGSAPGMGMATATAGEGVDSASRAAASRGPGF